jgi:Domain of Unknown Function (DUF1080).
MRFLFVVMTALLVTSASAAEKIISFKDVPVGATPAEFKSLVLGFGKPGDWKVESVEETGPAGTTTEKRVLTQTAREPLANRFPILLHDEVFSDFRLETKFKITGGALEQSAGMVFRFQNESNYYVIRADALGNSFRCYKVENGDPRQPYGPAMKISANEWHTLVIQCEGTRILCAIDGQDAVKLIDNSARRTGRVGFWTKSDTAAQFSDVRFTYTPHQPLAQALVRDALEQYPRVLDLAIFASRNTGETPVAIAAKNSKDLGEIGTKTEEDVIVSGKTYYGKGKEWVVVTMPLRDRNGDPIAAVRLRLRSFPGQTEDNAIVRAMPIVKGMQPRVQSLEELID